MDELISDFTAETYEGLQNLEQILLSLETNPKDMDKVRDAFRILHTIKGTCGFLGFHRMQSVAHRAENVLSKMRDGDIIADAVITSTLFVSLDTIRQIVDHIESSGTESSGNDEELLQALDKCLIVQAAPEKSIDIRPEEISTDPPLEHSPTRDESSDSSSNKGSDSPRDECPRTQESADPSVNGDAQPDTPQNTSQTTLEFENALHALSIPPPPSLEASSAASLAPSFAEQAPNASKDSAAEHAPHESHSSPSNSASLSSAGAPPSSPASQTAGSDVNASPQGHAEKSAASQSIRISLDVVDNLMALVGELVLTRNQLLQQDDEAHAAQNNVLTRLSHLTSELQHHIMQTRMQPIESAWTKLPRIVRDISNSLGKRIQLKQVGADTELDRQVVELIKDPLMHMVRNSADHGIETIEERRQAGKKETGTITLKAYHHGGHIVIEISDDGKGMDPEKLRQKALEKGLISQAEAESMGDEKALQLIFSAGFSTAQTVSNISGRGVGMDVVRSNMDKLGGSIDMTSKKGVGSTFTIKIPLTLSIISVLLVKVTDQIFAIPQLAITEILRIRNDENIRYIQGVPLIPWRNQLLPLLELRELLKIPQGDAVSLYRNVVIMQAGAQYIGCIVDSIHDSQEIVVKPLSKKLEHLKIFSGSTILGTGEVVLILDPNNIDLSSKDQLPQTLTPPHNHAFENHKKTIILLFKQDQKVQAVPLALVGRIDEINPHAVEHINNQNLFLYRGHLIPILGFDHTKEYDSETSLPVLIFTDRGYKLALHIEEIIDIVEDSTEIQLEDKDEKNLGTAVIQGTPTVVIDCQAYFREAYPKWSEFKGKVMNHGQQKRLLLVDDSTFFLNLISPLLKVSGFSVQTASSADYGLQVCLNNEEPFDVIISDIEMPEKNGYDFLKEIRSHAQLANIPVIALSGCDTEVEIKRAKEAGFKEFVPKTDQQNLIRVLNQMCGEQSLS